MTQDEKNGQCGGGQGGSKKSENTGGNKPDTELLAPNQVIVDIKRAYVQTSGNVAISISPEEKLSVDLIDLGRIYIGNESSNYFVQPKEVSIELTENVAICIFSAADVLQYIQLAGIQDGSIYVKAYLKSPISFDAGITWYEYIWGTTKIKTTIGRGHK